MATPLEIQNIYPLSPMQEGMLYHALLDQDSLAYTVQVSVTLKGALDVDILEQSFQRLVDRHDILRTMFIYEKVDRPRQVVLKQRTVRIGYVDLTRLKTEMKRERLKAAQEQDKYMRFDLAKDTLMRMTVIRISPKSYRLLITRHHILMDGWCTGILFQELMDCYAALLAGGSPEWEPVPPYSQYIQWLGKQNPEGAASYWRDYLEGYEGGTTLPMMSVRGQGQAYRAEETSFILDEAFVGAMRNMASNCQVTDNIWFQTLWAAMLQHYNDTHDVVFGAIASGRPAKLPGVERMVGLFINTLPVRANFGAAQLRFDEALQLAQERSLASEQYAYYPLYEMQTFQGRNQQLFDHILAFENFPLEKDIRSRKVKDGIGFTVSDVEIFEQTNFDLNVVVVPGREWRVTMKYNGHVYNRETMDQIERHFRQAAAQVLANPAIPMNEIELISIEEKSRLLQDFNHQGQNDREPRTIHALFEERAALTPDAVAIVCGRDQLSYGELNRRANRLARILITHGVGPDFIVPVLTERSVEMIVGMLAVLKAGGAFLPVDPSYPDERIRFMLDDSGTTVILTKAGLVERIQDKLKVVLLDESPILQSVVDDANPATGSLPGHLAYVIYTSGTSGLPKGVLIEHRSLVNLCKWHIQQYEVTTADRSAHYAAFGFDASVWETFPYLVSGATIYLVPDDARLDSNLLRHFYDTHQITIGFLPTPVYEQFAFAGEVSSLRILLTGGDQLKQYKPSGYRLYNNYGPTENTVVSTSFEVDRLYSQYPIGKPIPNTQAIIMDRNGRIQPVDVPGELCIAGAGLARGYLNRPELTARKFIPHPWNPAEKLYRTGDLARRLADGTIEYLGRGDTQVKIRGNRVEIGEVESRILQHKAIREAVVEARSDREGALYLCAYYTTFSNEKADMLGLELKKHMEAGLPGYMVPSSFIRLDRLPLTVNGKVDRTALPQPEIIFQERERVDPSTEMERQLADIWKRVLKTEDVGIHDDFFELGGHSLKATALMTSIRKTFDIAVSLQELFAHPTVEQQATLLLGLEEKPPALIERVEPRPYYPVSSAQKRLLLVHYLDESQVGYNLPGAMMIEGDLHIERFQESFRRLIKRHESLRTSFGWVDGEPVQYVHEQAELPFEIIDTHEEGLVEQLGFFVRPFDLACAPLMRVKLLRLEPERYCLLFDMHHLISDGMSRSIFIREWTQLYEGEQLPALSIQYKDYAVWQNWELQSDTIAEQAAFWKENLAGEIQPLQLPVDYTRPSVQSFEGDRVSFSANKEVTEKLRHLAKDTGSTLYMVLLAVLNVFLTKYTGQTDIIVGSPVAGRTHPDKAPLIGMFVNTLALRNYPREELCFHEFVREVRSRTLKAFEHQDYPFEELLDELDIKRDLSRHPLFDVMFVMNNTDPGELEVNRLTVTPYPVARTVSKFDLTLSVSERQDGSLACTIEYSSKLFKPETVLRMSEHLCELMRFAAAAPNELLSNLMMIGEKERELLLDVFNDTQAPYDRDMAIHQLFERQAFANPERFAVIHGEERLTYRELDAKANRLASGLRSAGIGPEVITGIVADRSTETIIGMLGILKAGGAYLPLDPEFPEERTRFMLDDAGAACVLIPPGYSAPLGFQGCVLHLDMVLSTADCETQTAAPTICGSDNLAYVMYTSGTTGKPKGVMVENRSVVRLVQHPNFIQFRADDRILLTGNMAFDATTFEIWGALLNGLELHLVETEQLLDAFRLARLLDKEAISIMWLTSPLFNQLAEQNPRMFAPLRYLLVGGDILNPKMIATVRETNPNLTVINGYGPTENTTFSTAHIVKDEDADGVPIGRPLQQSSAYVLDAHNRLQPIGVVGELCVGGDGLARGYLNLPDLTAEKFIAHPFLSGERLYRTGDLAKWRTDGVLDIVGRIDNQVKIRGFRVELNEVEHQLLQQPEIRQAVVIVRRNGSGNDMLCAYVVTDVDVLSSELKRRIGDMLPLYMVPEFIQIMDKLPLTLNGKVDKNSLPLPDEGEMGSSPYVAPVGELEVVLADIFETVLKIQGVGAEHHFFECGGHSLKAITLLTLIKQRLGREIPLREVFRNATVRQLAAYLKTRAEQTLQSIEPAPAYSHYPVSSAQKRMMLLSQLEPDDTSYNIPSVVLLEGNLNFTRFEESFRLLIERHESLRTSFVWMEGEPVQVVHDSADVRITLVAAEESEAAAIMRAFVKPFDISNGPLIRALAVRIGPDQHILMIDMHHIISDGLSHQLLIHEWKELYRGSELPQLSIHYKDYAVWQQQRLHSEDRKVQEKYWVENLDGELPVLDLPTDFPRPSIQNHDGDRIAYLLPQDLTDQLRNLAADTGTTLFMVMIAVHHILLHHYTGAEDTIVGIPIAGRTHPDVQPLVGLFVNTLALRQYPQGSKTFRTFLEEVKRNCLDAFEHQDYPFEELVEKLDIRRDLSRSSLFDTFFVFNRSEGETELIGDLTIKPYSFEHDISKFDWTLTVTDKDDRLNFSIRYCTSLFKRQTMERLADHFIQLLRESVMNLDSAIGSWSMVSSDERDRIINRFNDTRRTVPSDSTISQLFEQQVEAIPEAIAVVTGGQQLTYCELNNRANALAKTLLDRGVQPDQTVGLLVDRSLEMIIGMLAILKAGAAYLPIDPTYPKDRIAFMLEDSATRLVLTKQIWVDLVGERPQTIWLDRPNPIIDETSEFNAVSHTSKHLAYVIYTSGTTGQPKGVMIEQRSVVNLIYGLFQSIYEEHPEIRNVAGVAPFVFDMSIKPIFGALLFGRTLHLVPEEMRVDGPELIRYFERWHIDLTDGTPTYLRLLLHASKTEGIALHTKHFVIGGEPLPVGLVQDLLRACGEEVNITNVYGPTECTVDVTAYPIEKENLVCLTNIPIGKPLCNQRTIILNENGEMVPVGVAGEIYLSGDGVARGYLNRPELTAERFLTNPFWPAERMFRTGDLGRWLPDGNIEYLGRADDQIKIRGYRIEPGEIQSCLLLHDAVKEAAVISRKDETGAAYLCAYLVADCEVEHAELREHLGRMLPAYMVPTHYMMLPALPVTTNGKLDRKSLPAPESVQQLAIAIIPPRNEIESRLTELWQELLGVQPIGVKESFFELGGHSLKVAQLRLCIRQELKVDMPMRDIYQRPTIEELAMLISKLERTLDLPMRPSAGEESLLTSAQKRLLFIHQLDEVGTGYNMPGLLMLNETLDHERAVHAFRSLIKRHKILRTSFGWDNGQPFKRVEEEVPFELPYLNAPEQELTALVERFVQPFNLERAPLLRAVLVRLEDDRHALLLDMHHIISDGVTRRLLWEEWLRLYEGETLPEQRVQYDDYAAWQLERLQNGGLLMHEAYWMDSLSGELPVLELSVDRTHANDQRFHGDKLRFTLDTESTRLLKRLAADNGCTLFMALLAAYNVFLAKHTGQQEFVVGTPVAGRTHPDTAKMAGMFANTLALRNYPSHGKTFRSFMAEVRENTLHALEHQEYPFEELLEKLNIRRDMNRHPLFETMFVLENLEPFQLQGGGLSIHTAELETKTAKFPLSLAAAEQDGGLTFTFEYSTVLFSSETVQRFAQRYVCLLRRLVEQPDMFLERYSALTSEETQLILQRNHLLDADYSRGDTIQCLFESQADRTPDRIAVVYGGIRLTYKELDDRANRLAAVIRRKGVRPDVLVGVMVERSVEMIVALLAILKAGGAYVPIDPEYPQERIRFILEDCDARILLTQKKWRQLVPFQGEIVELDDTVIEDAEENRIEPLAEPHHLAYVIYTSGTTGLPKGVMIEHRNVVRLLFTDKPLFHFGENDVWTMFHSYCFDFSVWEMYGALLTGGRLVIVDKLTAQDTRTFTELLKRESVTVLNQTPTAFLRLMREDGLSNAELNAIRYVIFGGEALSTGKLADWKRKYPLCKLINMYGITETTVHVTYKEITDAEITDNRNNIGEPIPTLGAYILNTVGHLTPMGVAGELYIAGAGVARGYLNRQELTEERMVDDPFRPGEKMYRTGDLARLLPDGGMEYLGRIDHQVKIRGYRIELGEIENVLAKCTGVRETVILASDDQEGDKQLVCYYTNDAGLTPGELRDFAAARLPHYMVPSYFLGIDEFPLTANGKLNVADLPKPAESAQSLAVYAAPVTALESSLAEIWKDILGLDRVGIDDRFFEIGGHSLKATGMLSKVQQAFDVKVPLKELFVRDTVRQLAAYIQTLDKARSIRGELDCAGSLSAAQRRLLVLQHLEDTNVSDNITAAFSIEGNIDRNRLEQAVQIVMMRHEELRAVYSWSDGDPIRQIMTESRVEVEELTDDGQPLEIIVERFVRPFDPENAPLLRIGWVENLESSGVLLLDVHPVIADNQSLILFVQELLEVYESVQFGKERANYQDYVEWQATQLQVGGWQNQESYWLDKLSGEIPILAIPTDYPRPAVVPLDGEVIQFSADKRLTTQLTELAETCEGSIFSLLLGSFQLLLTKYAGQEDIIIGTHVSGRHRPEWAGLVGRLENMLALRIESQSEHSFMQLFEKVSTIVREGFANQDYPFERLIDQVDVSRDLSRNPLFDVVFAMKEEAVERRIGSLTLKQIELGRRAAKYDISLVAWLDHGQIQFQFTYRPCLYKRSTVESMARRFLLLLGQVVADPQRKVKELSILAESEIEQILSEFNDTQADYPHKQTVSQWFEEQVSHTPNQIALLSGERKVTYRELNERANRLARSLRDIGVRSNTLVAVLCHRSVDMLVGIFAILKAGGAYVPIDPALPSDRIAYILSDSGARIMLSQKGLRENAIFTGETIHLDDERWYDVDCTNIEPVHTSSDLAYVIYTSGSTGRPKGTQIRHYSLMNGLNWLQKTYPLDPADVILQKTPISFDLSVWELFWWAAGATLSLLPPEGERDVHTIVRTIHEHEVTVLFFVPSMLNVLLDRVEDEETVGKLASIRQVFACGEVLHLATARRFHQAFRAYHTKLINLYGPTESTVHVTYYECDDNDNHQIVPIGKPIDNIELYVVSPHGQLQPVGIAGELCISGAGLSKSYWNRPELTNEKFIANPWKPGELMYRTGDLAMWMADGNLTYLGRIDNQIKLRGYRIELGEIESQLLRHGELKEVTVAAISDTAADQTYLCAYFTSDRPLGDAEIHSFAAATLPSYMIPPYFVQLETIPLTSNGKVDRRKLPVPRERMDTGLIHSLPRNEVESVMAGLWEEVLGRTVGINEHFFRAGGDSLKAIMLLTRIHRRFHLLLSLSDIFQHPTIGDLALLIGRNERQMYVPIEASERRNTYPAALAQKRLLIIDQMEGENRSYNIPSVMQIHGKLNIDRLQEVFQIIIDRHEAFRTSFGWTDGEPSQTVHDRVDFVLEYEEADNSTVKDRVRQFIRPFDLSRAPLVRAGVIKMAEEHYVLMMDMHHVIFDGYSRKIFLEEWTRLYQGETLPTPVLQFKDYAVWQNEQRGGAGLKREEDFWLDVFSGEIPVLQMPLDYSRPAIQSYEGDMFAVRADQSLTAKLHRLAHETGSTLFMVLLAAFNVLLHRYSGQEDVIIGTPIAGRTHPDTERMIGMFVNTLALRCYPEGRKTFTQFLEEVKTHALKAYEHQEYPFEELVDKLGIRRDLSRHPLFDALIVLHNIETKIVEISDIRVSPFEFDHDISKFELSISANKFNGEIEFTFEYGTRLYKRETVEQYARHYLRILEDVANEPDQKLSDIRMLSDHEETTLLYAFNQTDVSYPKEKTIQRIFEEQVEQTPERIAVAFNEQSLTYSELNRQANRVATTLRANGVVPDTRVAVMTERSLEMVVGLIGILKAGGAYVPIDPEYPSDRIQYMLEDSGSMHLLTQRSLLDRTVFHGNVFLLDDAQYWAGQEEANLTEINTPADMAYIIYTSGTTGKPKGVAIEHGNVVRLMKNERHPFEFDEHDVWTMFHSYCFDFSVWEMYGALLYGGKVVIVPKLIAQDPVQFLELLKRENVTVLNQTPTAFYHLVHEELQCLDERLMLRYVIFGGEALSPGSLKGWRNKYPSVKLINMYGITETTVHVTHKEIDDEDTTTNVSNIGKPIPTLKTYILDGYGKPVPIGVPGELYVSGKGVARGYLNRPELTAERFVPHFQEYGERMYRSGDLVKWLPDGSMEYLGRIDHQIKIRGFRIELGEIETQLLKHSEVRETLIIAREDQEGAKYLCAYFVADKTLQASELREHVGRELPYYMVPSFFVQLDHMPLTSNGKIDRRQLPEPESQLYVNDGYIAPRTHTERRLAEIWEQVLGLTKVGVKDNFFELGGHSLKATRLASRIYQLLQIRVSARDVLVNQTIETLATHIEQLEEQAFIAIKPVSKQPYYAASSAQKGLFLLYQFQGPSIGYNIPAAIIVEGNLQAERIEAVFQTLARRHETLRTSFDWINGEPVQRIEEDVRISVERIAVDEPDFSQEMVKQFVRPFDLSKAPLIRVRLASSSENRHLLLFDSHHIISDGTSMRILIREFIELYNGHHLTPLTVQYKDFSAWQTEFYRSDAFIRNEEYWLSVFKGDLPALSLPTDFPRPPIRSFEGARCYFTIDEHLTGKLRALALHEEATLFTVLLAAYYVLLFRYTNQSDIVVGTPFAGRQHIELEGIVGMFVNTLALRLQPKGELTFSQFLASVKQSVLQAHEHQDYPFDRLIELLDVAGDRSRQPLFDCLFVLQNAEQARMNIDGLRFKPFEFDAKTAKYDLTLSVTEGDFKLQGCIEYAASLFRQESGEQIMADYLSILASVSNQSSVFLKDIDLDIGERAKDPTPISDFDFFF